MNTFSLVCLIICGCCALWVLSLFVYVAIKVNQRKKQLKANSQRKEN